MMKGMTKRIIVILLALTLLFAITPVSGMAAGEKTGTFTVVSMNVDGLPQKILFVDLNKDGPGSDGTKKISEKMATYGWDIIGVSEDFNYNTELMSGLGDYNSGTHRGGVSGLKNDTDGLNLIWKKSISVTGEKWISWDTYYSSGAFGTGNGADGMIDKGYRFYQAAIAEGVTVDVYILHMDADSDAEDIAARESQLTQLANAIKASNNGNPIIVMGDTNCRYTRESLQEIFIDGINADSRFTIQDTWVEKVWNGVYPAKGAEAMVAVDKGGTYDYPQAEIVDKIFYINNSDSQVTLKANSHTVATDFVDTDGTALADHWPVVVEFSYTVAGTEPTVCQHDYEITSEQDATCTEAGSKTYTCLKCGDSYTETIAVSGHKFQDGSCIVCGTPDPDYQPPQPPDSAVLGERVSEIVDGSRYVIAFDGSTGLFSMNLNDAGTVVPQKLAAQAGMTVDEEQIWTLKAQNGGYTISAVIDGRVQYLGCTKTFTGYGYKVGLQDSAFVWSVSKDSKGYFRFYAKAGYGSTYYLRYYNAKQGWIASTRAAGLTLYEVDE